MTNFDRRSNKVRSTSMKSLLIYLLLLLFVGYMVVSNIGGCNKPSISNTPVVDTQTTSNTTKSVNSSDFVFTKNGELNFAHSDKANFKKIDIEIVENDAKRQQGLMYRENMEPDQGMLFLFDVEEPQAFWMENTKIPLDIIYIDKDWKIVSIAKNTVPYSQQSIPSKGPAKYVLEVNAGFSDAYKIGAGDFISYTRN